MKRFYTDGSSTINVRSAYCVTDDKGTLLELGQTKAPCFTNNEEEYRGVIAALKLCSAGDEICSDSMLVVNQVKGNWKTNKPHLKSLCAEAKELLAEKKANLAWVPREENLAGKHFE